MSTGRFFKSLGQLLYGLAAVDGAVSAAELQEIASSIDSAAKRHFERHGYFVGGMLLAKISFLKALQRHEHPVHLIEQSIYEMERIHFSLLSSDEKRFIRELVSRTARASEGVRDVEKRVLRLFMDKSPALL